MGVIDLDKRVKKLEAGGGGGADPGVIDQLEAAVTDLEETINGDGETDLGLVGDVAALEETVNGDGETSFGLVGDVAALKTGGTPVRTAVTTLTSGSVYSAYGGVYYERLGNLIHVHVAASGVSSSNVSAIFTLPEAIRPATGDAVVASGWSFMYFGDSNTPCKGEIKSDGVVSVKSGGTYAIIEFYYMIGQSTT